MKQSLILVFTLALSSICSANTLYQRTLFPNDTLSVAMDLDSAYVHFTTTHQSNVFEGYTIQLFSGNRSGANAVRANIISLGAADVARMVYREPNFKIHVGSYPDASSAERALLQWKSAYPDAFVLKTLVPWYPIELPESTVPSDTTNSAP